MKATCSSCANWAGTPESIMAYCTLPKAGIMFTVTGKNASCARYEGVDKPYSGPHRDESLFASNRRPLKQKINPIGDPII